MSYDVVTNPAAIAAINSKGKVNSAGTFTPQAAQQGPRLNPFVDPSPWGKILVGGLDIGFVLDVDGAERPEDWNFQKDLASSGAISVWRGTKLAEAIKVSLAAANLAAFDGLYILVQTLRPKIGSKPPALAIVSPVINFNGITKVAQALIGQPKWNKQDAYWTIDITLCQYSPAKRANTGPADPAKPDAADPNADVKAALQKTLDQAAKA